MKNVIKRFHVIIKHSSRNHLDWNGLHFFQYNLGQFNLKLESLQRVHAPQQLAGPFHCVITDLKCAMDGASFISGGSSFHSLDPWLRKVFIPHSCVRTFGLVILLQSGRLISLLFLENILLIKAGFKLFIALNVSIQKARSLITQSIGRPI